MDSGWLVRLRWRRRGAWLWPAFIGLTVADAVAGHALPPTGDTQSIPAAGVAGLLLNLIAVILLSRPLGMLLRRFRPDLPGVIASNYGGTAAIAAVFAALLAAGLLHRATVIANERAMRDATVRAQAWIGDRAPAEFRRNVGQLNTLAIQPGSIYRTCVSSDGGRRSYCVIVKTNLPLVRSVSFAGYEPNALFAEGLG
jgi:hypothetical protein